MDDTKTYSWIPFYTEFANKLLVYKENHGELIRILQAVFADLNIRYPFNENDGKSLDDICPFTVFGAFNKGITNQNRTAIMSAIAKHIGVKSKAPTEFDGIPVMNNMRAWFINYKTNRKPTDIPELWALFESAIRYADSGTEPDKATFVAAFDKVKLQPGIKWNITMGLYWIRPYAFLNLDERNRAFITKGRLPISKELIKISNLKQVPSGTAYMQLINACKDYFETEAAEISGFPSLSQSAWLTANEKSTGQTQSTANFLKWFAPLIDALKDLGGSALPAEARSQIITNLQLSDEIVNETRGKNDSKKFDNEVAWARNYLVYEGYIDKSQRGRWTLTKEGYNVNMTEELASEIFLKWVDILKERREQGTLPRSDGEAHYWMYAPGEGSRKWDEFYPQGIMGIGWDELGDLTQYENRAAITAKMKEIYGQEKTYSNNSLATWQFVHDVQIGDIVFVKKGVKEIIGRGIVESDYIYLPDRDEYKNIRRIKWTHSGFWEHPGQAVMKTLTDVTSYTEYVQKLETLILGDTDEDAPEKEIAYDIYDEAAFLSEVFMEPEPYSELRELLLRKKNLILQGAPGVGKTFAAKRLAYSIMGEKDTRRVMMVQFHQSYSYEDFIRGYRPTENGFELSEGPFYTFCKRAEDDAERPYFFIIDEINRGNLSKIFGELLMLIEADKRGDKLRLLYSNELFSVPANVHIIGMMNTADRSLAMIDYALRRRFAFFEMEPAFDATGFQDILEEAESPKMNALIRQIKALNDAIVQDESLGAGFRIGHSYLCPEDSADVSDEWLQCVVKYELIPLIEEYWFDEKDKVERWSKRLRDAVYG